MSDQFAPGAPAPADSGSVPAESGASGAPQSGIPSSSAGQTYDVKINGKVEKVPLDELLNGYSRHQDYTRKSQALAERERQWQQTLSQHEQAFQEVYGFLNDRQRLAQYLQQLEQSNKQTDPNELVTAQDLQSRFEMMQQQNQQVLQQQLGHMERQIQVQHLTGEYSKSIDGKIGAVLTQYPELKSIRGIEKQLRFAVAQQQPQTLEDALQAFDEAAAAFADDLSNVIKAKATSPSPLNNGIEPKGGQGPMPPAQPNFKNVKDTRLRELVIQDLMKGGG